MNKTFIDAKISLNYIIGGIIVLLMVGCQFKTDTRAVDLVTPNILIIMCDQLNPKALGCYGGPVTTPNIDKLASEGVIFNNAVCPYPVCSPSRASMYLGKYPHEHGIAHNVMKIDYPAIPSPETEEGISDADTTVIKLLHQQGYETHHYGKWHLTEEPVSYLPDHFHEHHQYAIEMRRVFNSVSQLPREKWMWWYGWALPVIVSPAYTDALASASREFLDGYYSEFLTKIGRLDLPIETNFDVRVTDKTVEALNNTGREPFFIVGSFNYPHDPNVVPSPYYEMYDPDNIELPVNYNSRDPFFEEDWGRIVVDNIGEEGVREFLRIYYASVHLIDDQVGRILEALEDTGKKDNTIVVFTADHGDMMAKQGMIWKSTRAFYNDIMKVPLIISFPAKLKPDRTNVPINLADLAPTLLSLTNQEIPPSMTGIDYSEFLLDTENVTPPQEYVLCERIQSNQEHTRDRMNAGPGSFAIMSASWKYIRYPDDHEFLYHLSEDPEEMNNLAENDTYADKLKEMRMALKDKLKETNFTN